MSADFVDTNVLVYYAERDEAKYRRANQILSSRPVASVQVLNEFVSVARRRFSLGWPVIRESVEVFRSFLDVRAVTVEVHETAMDLAEHHRFSIYDATIVASALEAGCTTLWTEDMQHGQLIAGRLRIVNPFA